MERPRTSMGHSRQKSSGGESTRHLLKHARSESEMSTDSLPSESSHRGVALARVITPPSELNLMLSAPPPAARKASVKERSLPAPRRTERSAVMRRPTLSTVPSPLDNDLLSAVPLRTGAPLGSQNASQRNSFINMYGSRSPASSASTPDSSELGRPMMMLNDRAVPSFASPQSGSELGYTTDSDSDVPRSAFGDRPVRPQHSRSRSLRNEVQARLSMDDVPESSGLSSLAWATLVADAATSNGGVAAAARRKTSRRRSKSMESLKIPSALQPRTPVSATMLRERVEVPRPPQSASVTRLDSRANLRNGPSRMASYRTNEGVSRARTYR
ncbi:hypothetical protein EIP86_010896 [Pleurotus ostreatoroseus]|nr:hypothetical protein EIP86_010896 [Pleurotus ostreatoroseus]